MATKGYLDRRVSGPKASAKEKVTPKVGGVKKVAELLNHLPRELSDRILAYLDEKDNPLAENVRKEMFLFEDLMMLDDRSFQILLSEIPKESIPAALKGANERLKEKFYKNMSVRAAEMLQNDLEMLGPVKVSEVEAARQGILKFARQLEAAGRIVITGRSGEPMIV